MSNFTISLFCLVLNLAQKLLNFQRVTEGGKHCAQTKQEPITQAKFSECLDAIALIVTPVSHAVCRSV